MRDRDAGVVYLMLEGATALLQTTTWTTAAIYLVDVAHLGSLQLVLLGTIMEASIFVFEIPTGLVAGAAGAALVPVAAVLARLRVRVAERRAA